MDKIGDFPDMEHVKAVCKIGQGHDCCRYLTMGRGGWSCEKHAPMAGHIDYKVFTMQFTARGDNCDGKDSRT